MGSIGIYEIKNLINGKRYIGSSRVLNKRLQNHRSALIRGSHINKHLQSSWNKFGESSFKFSILLKCSTNDLLMYEDLIINGYKSNIKDFGYNLRVVPKDNSNIVHKKAYKIGEKHNRLTFLKPLGPPSSTTKWLVECDCGTIKSMIPSSIRNGHTTSCGCYHKERTSKTTKARHERNRKKNGNLC